MIQIYYGAKEYVWRPPTIKRLELTRKSWCRKKRIDVSSSTRITLLLVIHELHRALAVEDLASISAEDVFVGCVFFNRERHQQITTSMVLGSLLVQFINMRDIIPSDIVRTWVAHQEDSSLPHSRIMGSMLLTELRRFSKSFIIIDALDECPSQTQRELLFSLCAAQRDHPALHLLVSSRNMGGIGEDTDLDQAPVFEISAQAKDLHLYIENQVKIKHGLRLCRKNEDLLTQLKTTLIQKANGL